MKKKILFAFIISLLLVGCAPRGSTQNSPKGVKPAQASLDDYKDLLNPTIDNSKKKVPDKLNTQDARLIAASVSITKITDKLNLDLVGVPITGLGKLPERYENIPQIGMSMNPNVEVMLSLKPTQIYTPISLKQFLGANYEKVKLPNKFVDLNSVEGLYNTIKDIGEENNRKDIADKLIAQKNKLIDDFTNKYQHHKKPSVLIIMGLPGSYVVATPKSYVGNLVELAGGKNVFADDNAKNEEFLNLGPEIMLKKDPDIILRTAHAMPDKVSEMLKKEFSENGIWKHFRAVKENKVYDLPHKSFGMSATFDYMDGLNYLEKLFYGGNNDSN